MPGASTQEHHGTQQPRVRLDRDRDRDRRVRPASRQHGGLRDRQQHGREHRRRRAARAVRHARQRDREQRHRRRPTARLRREPVRGERRQRPRPQPVLRGRREPGGDLAVEGDRLRRLRPMEGAARATTDARCSPIPGSWTPRRTTTRSEKARPRSTPGRSWPCRARPTSRGEPRAQGGVDRHRRLRGRRAAAVTDAVDRRTSHATPAISPWLRVRNGWGRSRDRPQQRRASARRRRADPDRDRVVRAWDRRARALADRRGSRRPMLAVPRRRRPGRGGR